MSTRREREFESDGRLAARRGEDLAASGYARLRSAQSRAAFRHGYEAERKLITSETVTPEQRAESEAALATLQAFATTL